MTRPILRDLASQIEARITTQQPLTLDEMRALAASIRVAANLYEEAVVLQFRKAEKAG